ncbi:dodecin [Vibrio breoganii]
MPHHTYKKMEIVGSSSVGIDDAINNAVEKTSQSVHNMRWFEMQEVRGHIEEGKVAHWQVTVKIGFTLD